MKATKLVPVALITLLIFASCKKNDFQDMPSKESANQTGNSTETLSSKASFSDWRVVGIWSMDHNNNHTNYSASISDSAITSDIADNGLVLLFSDTGSSMESLPYQKAKVEWYYQITTGSIFITANVVANSSINKNQRFSYVILSKDQLSSLEGKGITRSQLMNSSYQNAVEMLK